MRIDDDQFRDEWAAAHQRLLERLRTTLDVIETYAAPDDAGAAHAHIQKVLGNVRHAARSLADTVMTARTRNLRRTVQTAQQRSLDP